MIPYHEAAIEMSKNILQYTAFIPLQNIAQGIIEKQTQSIAHFRIRFREISSADTFIRCHFRFAHSAQAKSGYSAGDEKADKGMAAPL